MSIELKKREYWPTKEWNSIDFTKVGISKENILNLELDIAENYSNINSVIIVKDGYIAYEKYFNNHFKDDYYHVASITKSFISALVGIAIDKGYIESVNQKVIDFFPEYKFDDDNSLRNEVSIQHLLTMSVPYPFDDYNEPLDQLAMQDDWVRYTLDMMGKNGEIGDFKYSTAGVHLLSAIITRCTKKNAAEFANENLFRLIGIKEIIDYKMKKFGYDELFGDKMKGWVKDTTGNSTGGWGLLLTPQDMARFGYLYLNNGFWNNQQVISQDWIEKSTNGKNYGYLWWLHQDIDYKVYLARGDGGNIICCLPSKDLVIVIASSISFDAKDCWELIKEKILLAMNE